MSEVYRSLKLRVQDTLQRGKANSTPLPPVESPTGESPTALGLNHEIEGLESLVADSIGKLKAAVKAREAMVAEEIRQAEQLAVSLKADVAKLGAKLKETEETVERKNVSRQKLEESLTAKIKDLQNDIKKKDETLVARDNELNDYKSKIDTNVKRIGELELGNRKTKEEAVSHAKRAEDLAASSQARISALESRLKEIEELAHQKESTIKELEQKLAAKEQAFESMVKDKQELVTRRDAEINDLKSQLKRLTKAIGEVSSFFRQAEALTGFEAQDASTAAEKQTAAVAEEKPAAEAKVATVPPIPPDAPGEMVAPEIFQRITNELAEVTDVIGPLASLIVRRQVKALGESIEKFPRRRLPELLESLAKEISDEKQQIDFRERLAQNAQWTLN
jgi:DNA repair exonuclease SbcCD ATPase subunit